ncbi:MAG TPA: pyruvate dehydrogenase complex dihydrolipoamide acetyltransferase [Lacibacter sp.]|nr:pyruvate dehydrogenase complex dihydrolipoamide acetyltransferase [Lacibacter sp.]HMO87872.1 pyruvate dehydrogenase complex dihydrolipoamide acetyltransferase [Lacibacter sp.]
MAEVIRMPLLSDTMTEGKIVAWNKKVGDKVKSDDVLADVETDKATMEVVGYADGVLLYVGVPEGKAAKINEIIAIVGKEGEEYKHLLDAPQSATSTPEPATSNQQPVTGNPQPTTSSTGVDADALGKQLGVTIIRMPLLSDTMTEGKIVAWNKKVGDAVASDDNLADVETDKATMEVVPYAEGTLLYTGVEAGKAAKVNEVIAIIGKAGTDITGLLAALNNPVAGAPLQAAASVTAETAPAASSAAATAATTTSTNGRIKASPLAKKIAAEKGIDLKAIQGSGDGGRIVKADIDNFTPAAAATAPSAPAASAPAVPAFNPGAGEGYVDTPNSSMRKTIARRLSDSLYTAPHFFLTMEINMDNAMAARTQLNELSPVKISFQDMTIKAAAMALRQHPAVNSSWMGDFIRTYQHIHIGSAIALPDGLIVPVIRFADQKSLSQIAADAKELYDKARNKKIQPAEFSGNTFTISNLGMMDIEEFTAIINPPDSCILAVGRIREVVVRKGDGFGVTNVMKVTLSCDHRSVDGAVGAAFLQTFKKYLENPVTMLV